MSIDPFGGVHPCLSFTKTFGSVREDSLQNLWERARHLPYLRNRKVRDITPQCETCEYLEHCTVCVAALILDKGEDFTDCGDNFLMAQALAESRR